MMKNIFPDKSHTENLSDDKNKIIQEKIEKYEKFVNEWNENVLLFKNSDNEKNKKLSDFFYSQRIFKHINGKLYTTTQKSGSCAYYSYFWALFHVLLFKKKTMLLNGLIN